MNKDLLIADQAGLIGPSSRVGDLHEAAQRFAELVRADEREACAMLCEQPVDELQITDDYSEMFYRDNKECAQAIRARGVK